MQFNAFTIIRGICIAGMIAAQVRPQAIVHRDPIAIIGDQALYEQDLLPSIAGQLLQLKNQEYEIKAKALKNVLDQRLLEAEAKRNGLSTDALLEQRVDAKVPPATAAELEAYYLARKDSLNRPLGEIRSQLEAALLQAKRQQAREVYVQQLQSAAKVTILLSRPKVDVSPDTARLRGSVDAPVTIVEFSDFQCPYCQAAQANVRAVLDKYKDKVRLGFRDFPLRQIHPQAQRAAEAARCAGEQEKFWEYHDLLFSSPKLDESGLTEQAQKAGLDVQRFSACLASGKFKQFIENDLQLGMNTGISGTPAFFINGVMLVGNQPMSEFEKIIDSQLERKR